MELTRKIGLQALNVFVFVFVIVSVFVIVITVVFQIHSTCTTVPLKRTNGKLMEPTRKIDLQVLAVQHDICQWK